MPLSPDFYRSAMQQLSSARPVTGRKMFGGAGLYLDGAFFCILDDDKVFFKVDDATKAAYEEAGMGVWVMAGQPNDKYRELPAEVYADLETLGVWIDASAEVARRGAAKKKR